MLAGAVLLTFPACGGQTDDHAANDASADDDDGGSAPDSQVAVDAAPTHDAGVTRDGAPTQDAAVEQDATLDAALDALQEDTIAPRPLAPLSTSRVTSRRPTLHWLLPVDLTDVIVDLCLDRACTQPIGAPAHVTGSSYSPPVDLPTGVVFWRLHPATNPNVTSATWELSVGARSAPVDTSWGTMLDVNGDGFSDVAVGSPQADTTGAVFVFLGSSSGLSTTAATTLIGPSNLYDTFGWTVASAGDVNGDGFADLAVATRGSSGGPSDVYVYEGGSAGLGVTPITLDLPGGSGFEYLSVSSGGDVNGDGYADLVVGGGPSGLVFLYLGAEGGPTTTPATTITGAPDVDASTQASFIHAAGAGDVNGDGFGDIVVAGFEGSWGMDNDTFIYLGSAHGLALTPDTVLPGSIMTGPMSWEYNPVVVEAGDVNGDGYADVLAGTCVSDDSACVYLGSASGVAQTPATVLVVPSPAETAGCASAGDVNGDGYSDVILSAFGGEPIGVYLGGAGGLATAPAVMLSEPQSATDGFGQSVASAGDVNGDGFADIVVGAPLGTPTMSPGGTGSAYVFLGSATALSAAPATTLVGVVGDSGQFGESVFGASN